MASERQAPKEACIKMPVKFETVTITMNFDKTVTKEQIEAFKKGFH